jgi:aryl-alcohol dehydrogenase-like predicted oxidoreductase
VRLAGARNAEQAISNAAAMDFEISKEELDFINGELGKV